MRCRVSAMGRAGSAGAGRERNQSAVRYAPRPKAKTIPIRNVAAVIHSPVWHRYTVSMDSQSTPDLERHFLRHTVATLRYRASKALCGAPEGFTDFRAAEGSRTAGEILAHIGDLFDWANRLAKEGKHEWHDSAAIPWEQAT